MIKEEMICGYGFIDYHEKHYPGQSITPIDSEQVNKCRQFIREKMKPNRRGHTSYHLKHVVEKEYNYYIANGAFIVAAIREGVPIKRDGFSPNVIVFMSYQKIKE